MVRLGYKETPEDSAEYRNDEFTDEEEFVEHVEQSEETVEPNLPYDRYTEELLEQDYWNTHFDQRIREIFDPYVEKTLGPGLMKEYRALLPYLGRDVDLGPKHPLKHNIPYSLFQEPAEQVWAEEEVMAIEREHAMDDEELTQRIAKQFKRAGLYLNKVVIGWKLTQCRIGRSTYCTLTRFLPMSCSTPFKIKIPWML